MRRLPVFFVLDCSESMAGENLTKMEQGLQSIIKKLRTDPHALESVYISVIAFAGVAKTVAPLIEVASFYPPRLPLGGGTSLGAALDALMAEIDKSVVKTTADRKGDWKPIVYLFTDGRPTDNPTSAIRQFKERFGTRSTVVAIGLGKDADFSVLRQLTDNVIQFEDVTDGDFSKFVAWVSASVVAQSKSVGEKDAADALPALDPSIMRIIKEGPQTPMSDEACVTLVGRCQRNKRPYIIKYERERQALATRDFKLDVLNYHLTGCYPLDEEYFGWTDPRASNLKVNTSALVGSPGCPHCGNLTAFAVCACGNLMCVNGDGVAECPWCERDINFGSSASDDGFDVQRGRG